MLFLYFKTSIIYFTIIIFWNILHNKNTGAYSVVLNASEEIKSIFHDGLQMKNHKGLNNTGIYAEGGVVNDHIITYTSVSSPKATVSLSKNVSVYNNNNNNISESSTSNSSYINTNSSKKNEINKNENIILHKLIPVKLNEPGSSSFLGMPEVLHINGTSSIKPRKGVYYNKIVARKGVGLEEDNGNITTYNNCIWFINHNCSKITDVKENNCYCCKIDIIPLVMNCTNCRYINATQTLEESGHECQRFCCDNQMSNQLDTYRVHPLAESESKPTVIAKNSSSGVNNSSSYVHKKTMSNKSGSKSKLKPQITKVPYDIDIVTNLLADSSKEIIIPVAASIFLIPMIGILIYFIWRRTKDYWEKRYYKRMDFLIDGMYND